MQNLARHTIPLLTAACLLAAGLGPVFAAPAAFRTAATPAFAPTLGPTESQLKGALPGKTLVRVTSGEFQRLVSTQGNHGRLITGPALAALLAGRPTATPAPATRTTPATPVPSPASTYCPQADSLAHRRCLDSLTRARTAQPPAPRALQEIENARGRDTVFIGPDGRPLDKAGLAASEDPEATDAAEAEAADEVQQERNRGYIGQFFFDLSRGGGGGGGDWDGSDWAVVLYVVIGVVVVGAFLVGGGAALYDLIVNKEKAPIFKEVGARFSYSGVTLYGNDGAPLYRDAYLAGLRLAIGVQRTYASLGLAVEGGSVNLSVSGFPGQSEAIGIRGGYLVGGPMVRFGNYHPLALTLEFLNGTSDHDRIGWISKTRMMLAAKAPGGLLVGAHLGAVYYDLNFTDGLVFRDGDLNRDLSVLVGLDAGWAF